MTDNTLRLLDDFVDAMDPIDTPFLNMIPPLPKIGEKDQFGRTLVGYTEVDEGEAERLRSLWWNSQERLYVLYDEQGFEPSDDIDHEGYWVPIQTPESDALYDEVCRLHAAYHKAAYSRPIFDPPEIPFPRIMEWGLAKRQDGA